MNGKQAKFLRRSNASEKEITAYKKLDWRQKSMLMKRFKDTVNMVYRRFADCAGGIKNN